MKTKRIAGISAAVLLFLAGGVWALQRYADRTATERVDAAFAAAGPHARIVHRGVRVNLLNRHVRVSGVMLATTEGADPDPVGIDELVIRKIDDEEGIPRFADVSLRGIRLTSGILGDDLADTFRRMGYAAPTADVDLAFRFGDDREDIRIERFRFSMPEGGSLECRLHLGNLTLSEEMPMAMVMGFPGWRIHSAELRYEDGSLAGRWMDAESRAREMDIREEMGAFIDMLLQTEPPKAFADGLAEIRRFIGDPRALRIGIAPANPLPIGTLLMPEDPMTLPELLGLTLEAG